MDRAAFLEQQFLKHFKAEPTPCQARLFREVAEFVTCDDADILVVNGYAGTGKTTAIAAVIGALKTRSRGTGRTSGPRKVTELVALRCLLQRPPLSPLGLLC